MDLNYDPGQSWWQKVLKDISNWWNGIPSWQKVAIGGIFVASSVALCFATAGMSAGVPLLGSATAGSALSAAAATALVELSIGIGFAVAGWALNSALTGSWDTNALGNDVADAVFFTGVFMFISSSVSAVKYVYRSNPYSKSRWSTRKWKFKSKDELNSHFSLHVKEFEGLYTTPEEYLQGANYVIKNGSYVAKMNGYVRFFGAEGGANYAFVGLTHNGKKITTFGIRPVNKLSKVQWIEP